VWTDASDRLRRDFFGRPNSRRYVLPINWLLAILLVICTGAGCSVGTIVA
jgi:hypothetical protein